MKVGDLVRYKKWKDHGTVQRQPGIIIEVDDSHRQKTVTVLNADGIFVEKVWIGLIEVVNE
jgi:hypothetical protein